MGVLVMRQTLIACVLFFLACGVLAQSCRYTDTVNGCEYDFSSLTLQSGPPYYEFNDTDASTSMAVNGTSGNNTSGNNTNGNDTTPASPSSGGGNGWIWWVVGGVAIVVLVAAVGAAGFVVYKKKQQSYDSIGYE